jgi:hypothetical protein
MAADKGDTDALNNIEVCFNNSVVTIIKKKAYQFVNLVVEKDLINYFYQSTVIIKFYYVLRKKNTKNIINHYSYY